MLRIFTKFYQFIAKRSTQDVHQKHRCHTYSELNDRKILASPKREAVLYGFIFIFIFDSFNRPATFAFRKIETSHFIGLFNFRIHIFKQWIDSVESTVNTRARHINMTLNSDSCYRLINIYNDEDNPSIDKACSNIRFIIIFSLTFSKKNALFIC